MSSLFSISQRLNFLSLASLVALMANVAVAKVPSPKGASKVDFQLEWMSAIRDIGSSTIVIFEYDNKRLRDPDFHLVESDRDWANMAADGAKSTAELVVAPSTTVVELQQCVNQIVHRGHYKRVLISIRDTSR